MQKTALSKYNESITLPDMKKQKDSLSQLRKDFDHHVNTDTSDHASIMSSLKAIERKLDGSPENPDYILRPIEATLKPITATYDTAGRMGKWVMTGLVIISLSVGIIWGIAQIAATKVNISLP